VCDLHTFDVDLSFSLSLFLSFSLSIFLSFSLSLSLSLPDALRRNLARNQLDDNALLAIENMAGLVTLDLSENLIEGAQTFNTETLLSLQSVEISSNRINRLEFLCGLPRLTALTASANVINQLSVPSQSCLTQLQTLIVPGNNLTALVSPLHYPRLSTLVLDGNPLLHISDRALPVTITTFQCNACFLTNISFLVRLSSLATLDLTNNQLVDTNLAGVSKLPRLRAAFLSGNNFASLPALFMAASTMLVTLELDYCQISHIAPSAFTFLRSLENLSLKHNLLTSVPANVFWPLKSLQELFLDGNQLIDIPDNTFSGLAAVGTLQLSANMLTRVPLSVGRLPSLQVLDLSDNVVEIVPQGSLPLSLVDKSTSAGIVSTINFLGNPTICSLSPVTGAAVRVVSCVCAPGTGGDGFFCERESMLFLGILSKKVGTRAKK
jgi:Leucine-rich repeat (LRR) protein